MVAQQLLNSLSPEHAFHDAFLAAGSHSLLPGYQLRSFAMPEQRSLQQVAVAAAAIELLAPSAAAQPFQPGTGFAPLGTCIPAYKSLPAARLALGSLPCFCMLMMWGAGQAYDAPVTMYDASYVLCGKAVFCDCAGNLRTQDWGGPYNLSLLPTQVNEIRSKP